jgi:uncharacterized protein (TIGR02594 family)
MAVQYRVTATALTVRKAPKQTAAALGYLAMNEIVAEVDDPLNGYWRHVHRSDGLDGFASHKYLMPVSAVAPGDRFPWMPIARGELGVSRFSGTPDNPRIVEYLRSTTLDHASASQDETFWCSAFTNWCVEKAGLAGTDSAWARNWLKWGKKLTEPVEGCIVVYSRGDGGHVGFFISQTSTTIQTLGGNQGDAVTIAGQERSRLLGFRTSP